MHHTDAWCSALNHIRLQAASALEADLARSDVSTGTHEPSSHSEAAVSLAQTEGTSESTPITLTQQEAAPPGSDLLCATSPPDIQVILQSPAEDDVLPEEASPQISSANKAIYSLWWYLKRSVCVILRQLQPICSITAREYAILRGSYFLTQQSQILICTSGIGRLTTSQSSKNVFEEPTDEAQGPVISQQPVSFLQLAISKLEWDYSHVVSVGSHLWSFKTTGRRAVQVLLGYLTIDQLILIHHTSKRVG